MKRRGRALLMTICMALAGTTMSYNAYAMKEYVEGRASILHRPYRDGEKDIEFSYVYFGSYPQSEVTGEALTEEIRQAEPDADGDLNVGEERYRMLEEKGERHYYRYEPIRWRVAGIWDKTAYLMADTIVDYQPYQENGVLTTWEDCDLRGWLNSRSDTEKGFLDTAFDKEEKAELDEHIIKITDGEAWSFITDAAVVPKLDDMVENNSYKNGDGYGIKASDYAAMKSGKHSADEFKWWCGAAYEREGAVYASYADADGIIQEEGASVRAEDVGVCPWIVLKLKDEGSWKTEEEKNEEEGRLVYNREKAGTIHNPAGSGKENEETHYSYLYMGSYPQSEVTGEALTDRIKSAVYNSSGEAVVCGIKYRRTGNGEELHYYRYEPIRWRVLSVNDHTHRALVLAENVLDYQIYNSKKDNKTYESTVYQWLNGSETENDMYGGFRQTAFEDGEDGLVRMQRTIKVGLPEAGDIRTSYKEDELSRKRNIALQSDYAASKCSGEAGGTPAKWWLDSEMEVYRFAGYIDKEGTACTSLMAMNGNGNYMAYQDNKTIGVRPAVIIDLTKTDAWMTEEEKQKEDRREMGNVNEDEEITLEDAALVLKAALKIQALSSKRLEAYADMNGNGRVELVDAQLVLRKALKIH